MKKGITGSTLKLIAVITMLIDHIGAVVVERALMQSNKTGLLNYDELYILDLVLRSIGRVAFPIFCFLLVEGFMHTKSVWKYAGRLALFAFVSELPFNLAFKGVLIEGKMVGSYQNVMFTMLIGFLVMIALDYIKKAETESRFSFNIKNKLAIKMIPIILMAVVIALGIILAEVLNTDYAGKGIIAIVALYLFRKNKFNQATAGVLAFSWEFPAPIAFLPILAYNGQRGMNLKYFFYFFYPIHLLVLYYVAIVF